MMSTRVSSSTIRFEHPFFLSGYAGAFPAGKYQLGVEEEEMSGMNFIAYRRTGTFITVRGQDGHIEMHAVSQQDLDAALARDRDEATPDLPGRSGGRASHE
jgi:hypothetical protein